VRLEVFTAVAMMIFWVLAPCTLIGRCQRFGETYGLHLQPYGAKTYIIIRKYCLEELRLQRAAIRFWHFKGLGTPCKKVV
jgi:hypothetical protein